MCVPIFGQFANLLGLERVRSAFTGQCKILREVIGEAVHYPKISPQHRGHTAFGTVLPLPVVKLHATGFVLRIQHCTISLNGHLRPFPGTGRLAISSSVIG